MIDLADRALRKLRELQFNRDARAVLASAPVRAADDGVILFSMIGTRVVLPYLVAAKSLHARLGRGRFAILDDGTLTEADKDLLARHLDHPEIRSIHAVDTGAAPRGGCWERLLTLLELRRDAYVIQLDSDTVTLGPVEEITQAIAAGRNFTLRGDRDAAWLPAEHFAADLAAIPASAHVQTKAESVMAELCAVLPEPRHYVRGCAGFAGFAPGGLDRSVAEAFSRKAEAMLGPGVWSQWGSEQVMSNVIVANEGEPVLLPYDRYLNFWNEPVGAEVAFVHFVGTYRYHGGVYARAATRAVAALDAGLARAA